MDEFTKIILSGILIMEWIRLGLVIANDWDKESRKGKDMKMVAIRICVFILMTIAIYIIIGALKFIWTY